MTPARPVDITIFLAPSFNSFATMGFVDPFRAANYLEGRQIFRWRFLSEKGGLCLSSNGTGIICEKLVTQNGPVPQVAVVSSSWTPEKHGSSRVMMALHSWARGGAIIAGLDTGAFIIAQSGLLRDRRATVHYEHIDSFKETYPRTDVIEGLFVFDDNIMTCCGGAAAVDFALHILHRLQGPELANAAARYIFQPGLRQPGTSQQPIGPDPLGAVVPSVVRRVLKIMEDTAEDPIPIPQICKMVGMSQRHINRLFAAHLKKSPALSYRDIRLDRARSLVTQTELSMSEIAVACGFSSQVHFSRAYKQRFGLPPVRDRIEGRVPFEFRAWPMFRKIATDPDDGQ